MRLKVRLVSPGMPTAPHPCCCCPRIAHSDSGVGSNWPLPPVSAWGSWVGATAGFEEETSVVTSAPPWKEIGTPKLPSGTRRVGLCVRQGMTSSSEMVRHQRGPPMKTLNGGSVRVRLSVHPIEPRNHSLNATCGIFSKLQKISSWTGTRLSGIERGAFCLFKCLLPPHRVP